MDAPDGNHRMDRHVAAYTLFGMMNWIYTWYDPAGPVGVEALADSICRLFLNGYTVEVPQMTATEQDTRRRSRWWT